jgi:hypothetical protein
MREFNAKRIASRPLGDTTPKAMRRRARQARRIREELIGAIEDPTAAEKSLAATAASMLVWLETAGGPLASGEVDAGEYSRVARTASRLLEQLGIDRTEDGGPFSYIGSRDD